MSRRQTLSFRIGFSVFSDGNSQASGSSVGIISIHDTRSRDSPSDSATKSHRFLGLWGIDIAPIEPFFNFCARGSNATTPKRKDLSRTHTTQDRKLHNQAFPKFKCFE